MTSSFRVSDLKGDIHVKVHSNVISFYFVKSMFAQNQLKKWSFKQDQG